MVGRAPQTLPSPTLVCLRKAQEWLVLGVRDITRLLPYRDGKLASSMLDE
jgi:hypothetical protein